MINEAIILQYFTYYSTGRRIWYVFVAFLLCGNLKHCIFLSYILSKERMGTTNTVYFVYNVQLLDKVESIEIPPFYHCLLAFYQIIVQQYTVQFIISYDSWIELICQRNESFIDRFIMNLWRVSSLPCWSSKKEEEKKYIIQGAWTNKNLFFFHRKNVNSCRFRAVKEPKFTIEIL